MSNKADIPKRRRDQKEGLKSKKAKRRERQAAEELEEERRLTSQLFGVGDGLPAYSEEIKQTNAEGQSSALFEIDRVGGPAAHLDGDEPRRDFEGDMVLDETAEPVWQDDDDEGVSVNLWNTSRLLKLRKTRTEAAAIALSGSELESRLRRRYQKSTQIGARTDWADISDKRSQEDQSGGKQNETDYQDSSETLLLGASAQTRLPPNILNTMRCPDANLSDPNQAVVQAVHFHPGSDPDSPLLLTAGFDKTLRFFKVGTEKSEKIHGIHCKSNPFH